MKHYNWQGFSLYEYITLLLQGDSVEEFQRLCEVQSDKATIEITSRYKGKVSRVRFIPGDIIKVRKSLVAFVIGELCK